MAGESAGGEELITEIKNAAGIILAFDGKSQLAGSLLRR